MHSSHRDRIFTDTSAYAPVTDPLEEHYENWIYRFRHSLFPDHHCYKCKPLMNSDQSSGVRPDLILVDHLYSEWVLVEVEKFSHSWSGHVSPQLEKLRSVRIGEAQVSAILKEAPELDPARLRTLMSRNRPRILVICNGAPSWSDYFMSSDAELMVVRPLRNEHLDLVLYSERQFQRLKFDKLSYLEPPAEGAHIGWYRITAPNRLDIRIGNYLAEFENGVFPCRTRRLGEEWYLVAPSATRIAQTGERPLAIIRFGDTDIAIDGRVIQS